MASETWQREGSLQTQCSEWRLEERHTLRMSPLHLRRHVPLMATCREVTLLSVHTGTVGQAEL